MIWWWGSGWGWLGGLINGLFWIVIIVIAVILLRRELPNLHLGSHRNSSPAIRLLEERYARGEINREEFLHRREVLLQGSQPDVPPPPATTGPPAASSEQTEKLPPQTPTDSSA